jgi:Ricin-type beta-trefoil lectin domain-like/O-Glycosyl hydrolase family 30/Bacterial Ig domain/HYR domain
MQTIKPTKRTLCFLMMLLLLGAHTLAAQEIKVDPNERYQVIEGWGTSLAWWAGVVGGWDEADYQVLLDEITSPDELNMNILKYNIHGGDNTTPHSSSTERTLPDGTVTHLRWESLPNTSYKPSPDAPYDWTANANQRKILLGLLKRNPRAILEAISYSPPYWMTSSGCSSGAVDGVPNLPAASVEPFADFLTDIVKHYHDEFGITFRTLEALNEANTKYWVFGGRQEGCGVDMTVQMALLNNVYEKLRSKNMLGYCSPSAADDTSIDQAFSSFNRYSYDDALIPKIGLATTHSYGGAARSGVSEFARKNGIKLWQSEFGGNAGSGTLPYIWQAEKIILDLNNMHVNAWLQWQIVSSVDAWGLYTYDLKSGGAINSRQLFKTKQYYSRKQFSKYIKENYQIIRSEDPKALTALSPDKKELVVVVVNRSLSSVERSVNLSRFISTGSTAKVIRTSNTEDAVSLPDAPINNSVLQYMSPPESITTFVIPVETAEPFPALADGLYRIKVKHSGKYMQVNNASNNNGAALTQWQFVDQDNLKFMVRKKGFDYMITPKYNEKLLTIANQSQTNGALLTQSDDIGYDHQRFYIIPDAESGYYRIVTKHSNKHLAVLANSQLNGGSIVQWTSLNGDNFKWQFEPVEEIPVLPDGTYSIKAVHSSNYLAVRNRASYNNALVEQRAYSSSDSLRFKVVRGLDGYYQFLPTYSSKAVTVNATTNAVTIFSNSEGFNQKFKVENVGANQFKIIAKLNPAKALAVNNAGQSSGDDVVLADYQNLNHFKWTFELNKPPVVTIQSPANGSSHYVCDTVTIAVTAMDKETSVRRVELYLNDALFATDNNKNDGWKFSLSNLAPGTYRVFAKAMDTDGDQAVSDTLTLLIKADDVAPSIQVPSDITVSAVANQCEAVVAIGEASAADNCSVLIEAKRSDGLSTGDAYPVGTTVVTWVATDQAGNTVQQVQRIAVIDSQSPTIEAPADITAEATRDRCDAVVDIGEAHAGDNCAAVKTEVIRSDGLPLTAAYPVGNTTITWTARDAAGNTATATQRVTVSDAEAPVLAVVQTISVPNDARVCGAALSVPKATATDNCSVPVLKSERSDGLLLTDMYPVGKTTITWTATDALGNTATATQAVTVNDAEAPVLVGSGYSPTLWPPNHEYHQFNVRQFIASVSDNCSNIDASHATILYVTSDEAEYAPGSGDTGNDIIIDNDQLLRARAERTGSGDGRVYTVHIGVADDSGNKSSIEGTIRVPKSQNKAAVRGSSAYSVAAGRGTTSARVTSINEDFNFTDTNPDQVVAYPNPVVGSLITIQLGGNEFQQVILTDFHGGVILSKTIEVGASKTVLATNELAPGMYFVQLIGKRQAEAIKIVKVEE